MPILSRVARPLLASFCFSLTTNFRAAGLPIGVTPYLCSPNSLNKAGLLACHASAVLMGRESPSSSTLGRVQAGTGGVLDDLGKCGGCSQQGCGENNKRIHGRMGGWEEGSRVHHEGRFSTPDRIRYCSDGPSAGVCRPPESPRNHFIALRPGPARSTSGRPSIATRATIKSAGYPGSTAG